jgi:hypothetical protein
MYGMYGSSNFRAKDNADAADHVYADTDADTDAGTNGGP